MSAPWVHEMVDRLTTASAGERGSIIESYQAMTGKSRQQLYRMAGAAGFRSGRQRRVDKGTRKTGLTDDQLLMAAGIQLKTGRENKGPIMPVDESIEILADNGYLDPGQVSASTMNRYLRESLVSRARLKEPTPHIHMRSLHPNHVHLADISVCIQYYLKAGRMGIMDERDFYKNKPDAFAKIKQKLLRYTLTDHFSGYFLVRYYVAQGESRENLWDFLRYCWRRKADPRLALFGVPDILLMDAGSAQQSHAMKGLFDALGVDLPKGLPYNPRRQGQVEQAHNIIETRFETRLRLCPAYEVDQLNAWTEDWIIKHCATRNHTRHGMTRLACWQLIRNEQIRELPDDDMCNLVISEPSVTRTVRNYQFSYQGETFSVKHLPGMHYGAKVEVSVNPFLWKSERAARVTWQDEIYEVRALRRLPSEMGGFFENAAVIGEEYKSQPQTLTQRAKAEIDRMAYGDGEAKKNAVPFEGLTVFGHQADKLPGLVPMTRSGRPIEVARPEGPVRVPIMDLFKRLRESGVAVTPALNAELREEFGDSVSVHAADSVVSAIVSGAEWRNEAAGRVAENAG